MCETPHLWVVCKTLHPWEEKLALSGLISVSWNYRKVACPNEALSDYSMKFKLCEWSLSDCFMRIKLWEWSSASLSHECCTALIEFLPSKLFRFKLCLWLNSICFVKLLYKSEFNRVVYFLQPLKVLPSSAYRLWWPYKRWAMLLFVPQWTFPHLGASHMKFSTRVYTLVYTRSCSACRLHAHLDRIQLGSGH